MNRPKIVVYQVASLDGRLTLAPEVLLLFGDERWQAIAGGDEEGYATLMERYRPQAILEGSGSFVLKDTPVEPLPPFEGDPEQLYEDFLPASVVEVPGRRWFTAVDSAGRVRWFYKEFPGQAWEGWHLLVLVSRGTPPEYLAYLRQENIPYLVSGEARVDLGAAMQKLAGRIGVTSLVSTAGGRLNGALLRAGLVDEVDIEFLPALIGGFDTPSLFDSPALQASEMPTRLKLLYSDVGENGRVRLHYEVLRE